MMFIWSLPTYLSQNGSHTCISTPVSTLETMLQRDLKLRFYVVHKYVILHMCILQYKRDIFIYYTVMHMTVNNLSRLQVSAHIRAIIRLTYTLSRT